MTEMQSYKFHLLFELFIKLKLLIDIWISVEATTLDHFHRELQKKVLWSDGFDLIEDIPDGGYCQISRTGGQAIVQFY